MSTTDREAVVAILDRLAVTALKLSHIAKGMPEQTSIREIAQSVPFRTQLTTVGHALLDASQLFEQLEAHVPPRET